MRISLRYGVLNLNGNLKTLDIAEGLSNALTNARGKLIRMGIYTEEDFENGGVQVVRSETLVDPLTEVYLEVTRRERNLCSRFK